MSVGLLMTHLFHLHTNVFTQVPPRDDPRHEPRHEPNLSPAASEVIEVSSDDGEPPARRRRLDASPDPDVQIVDSEDDQQPNLAAEPRPPAVPVAEDLEGRQIIREGPRAHTQSISLHCIRSNATILQLAGLS